MLPPLPLSALTVLGLFPAVICTVLIRSWRANLCPSVSLHTFPTCAPPPYERPRAHIHYGNDGLLASHQHDRMSQVAEQRLSDCVST